MISVLSVNYYSGEDLGGLAASLRAHRGGHEVELVVTNNSPEERISLERGNGLAVRVIEAGENLGFGRGVNLAFRESRGDAIFVANPDVRILAGTLDRAVAHLSARPDMAVLLPLLRYPNGEVQLSVRRFYTWAVALYARTPMRMMGWQPEFFRRYLCESLDRTRASEVDWGLGAAMFLKRADAADDVIFDERFFMYFEDVDLCYRMWNRGRRVVHCPDVECVHAHRRTSRNPFSRGGVHHLMSLWRFVRKHGGLRGRPVT